MGQTNMIDLPEWLAGILGISCLVIGVYLLIIWYGRGNNSVNKKIKDEPHTRFNITIDSRDFINIDTEQTKVFFDGLERIEGKDTKGDKDK